MTCKSVQKFDPWNDFWFRTNAVRRGGAFVAVATVLALTWVYSTTPEVKWRDPENVTLRRQLMLSLMLGWFLTNLGKYVLKSGSEQK
jgi:hypothetical protein